MKIVLLDRKTLGNDVNLDSFNEFGEFITYDTTSLDDRLKHIDNADIVITNKVLIDKYVMDNTNIKLICISATGMNNVDLEYAKSKNIVVKNVAGYSTNSVAQITFSLLHRAIQNIEEYNQFTKNGGWINTDIFTNIDYPFFEIADKNWGIIGLGNIGNKVAEIAKAYGANVSYYSTSNTNYNTNYNMVDLNTLIKDSDIISIHAPLNEKTVNLLTYDNMKLLKDNTIIINVARGGIINEYDITKILEEKNVLFVLDTITKEPMQKDNPLVKYLGDKRLIITPHIAWASIESRTKLIKLVYTNIEEFIKA